MFPNVSEWLIILLVVLVLFGANRIPKLAEDLGKSINSFKKGLKEGEKEAQKLEEEIKSVEDKKEE